VIDVERANELLGNPADLEDRPCDVVVVGSGPAAVAVAEELFEVQPPLRIAVIERGGVLLLTHFNNLFANGLRRTFIDRFAEHPWEGDMRAGVLLPALGGRGIASGAHLRRFDPVDFDWPDGTWPRSVVAALNEWYPSAEKRRRVSKGDLDGSAQAWAKQRLAHFEPTCPPVGVDLDTESRFQVSRGYDSAVSRLWQLLVRDRLVPGGSRLSVIPHLCVARVIRNGSTIQALECVDRGGRRHNVTARSYVLAASAIESARLVLQSNLDEDLPVAGRYLAEHIERRAKVVLTGPATALDGEGISLVINPRSSQEGDRYGRFQIHLRGEKRDNQIVVDIGGFAAMDPTPENRVTLAAGLDAFGNRRAHTTLRLSEGDAERAHRLCARIREVADLLGPVEFITDKFPLEPFEPKFTDGDRIQVMPAGRSYHEAGTLRIGSGPATSVTDTTGRVHGLDNLYAADSALFPCVGIANPMLTVAALAYHVASSIAHDLSGASLRAG
jgi:choline dehydrogenase-like flavoprotein